MAVTSGQPYDNRAAFCNRPAQPAAGLDKVAKILQAATKGVVWLGEIGNRN